MDRLKLRAFVIGPIGDKDAAPDEESRRAYEDAIEVLEEVIVPACEGLDVQAFRADTICRVGEINEQIFRHLRDSHIVIADLTGANPNVMYELGLRHTTGKLTVQIGEKGRLPFDVSCIRTILFKRTPAGLVSARRQLIATLAEGLEQGGDPVTATRVWLESTVSADELSDTNGSEEFGSDDEPGFLEDLANMESGIFEMQQTLERGSAVMVEISEILNQGTRRISQLAASQNYMSKKLALADQVATELRSPADRLQMIAQDLSNHVDRVEPGVKYLFASLGKEEVPPEATDFVVGMGELIDAGAEAANGAKAFSEIMEQSGDATRLFRRVTRAISQSARHIANSSERVSSWRTFNKMSSVE